MLKVKYVAMVGCQHYFGTQIFKPGLVLKLVKEPENPYDAEAIRVELDPIGRVGYVANSAHTVPRGCFSAGRIYDTFEGELYGIVRFVIGEMAILELVENVKLTFRIITEEKKERMASDLISPGR